MPRTQEMCKLSVLLLLYCSFVGADDIKIYRIQRCNENTYYPFVITKLNQLEVKDGYLYVSGSFTTDVDISSPVKASLYVSKYIKFLNIWIPIPCVKNVGSCIYYDLCSLGIPRDESCPENFIRANVPCRCPIEKGTYELSPENAVALFKIPEQIFIKKSPDRCLSPADGTYFIHATITTSNDKLLTCYMFYLDYDEVTNEIKKQQFL